MSPNLVGDRVERRGDHVAGGGGGVGKGLQPGLRNQSNEKIRHAEKGEPIFAKLFARSSTSPPELFAMGASKKD